MGSVFLASDSGSKRSREQESTSHLISKFPGTCRDRTRKRPSFPKSMEHLVGFLKMRVVRGTNLPVSDTRSSDPYVVVSIGDDQKLKTRVIKNNCNPEWNDELTLAIKDHLHPIILTVFDKDTFTKDDKLGDAEIDIRPYLQTLRMDLKNLPTPTTVSRVKPSRNNCLSGESCIVWKNGKIVQDMGLRLRNADCGEVEIQIEWVDAPGCKGLSHLNI